MRLRWILPPLAVLCLALVLWVCTRGSGPGPGELLESARKLLAGSPAERAEGRNALDEGLRLAQAPEQAELRAQLLDERSKVYAEDGLLEMALADCNSRLEEWGASTATLARACDLCLRLGEPGLALEHAEHLAALDPTHGQSLIGRCQVALADLPLAALERMARSALTPSHADEAILLAQRAAVFDDDVLQGSAALGELLELVPRAEERRRTSEWVHESAEHLRAARRAFVAGLAPDSAGDAAAGLQDLLLRGGAEREAADLGSVALSVPDIARPMPLLARTASALSAQGHPDRARALILELEKRNPDALDPNDLSSLALRDELEEWCLLLDSLGLWDELRTGAAIFCERTQDGDDRQKMELAWLLAATGKLRKDKAEGVQKILDGIGSNPADPDLALRVWLTRAELARREGERTQERYALLLVTRTAPLDPPPDQRAEIGRAWQRLAELNKDDGNPAAAEVYLTHALRCSSERASEVEPLWHEAGRKGLASRGATSPYLLYVRAKNESDTQQPSLALADATELLKDYPGLGPALELVSSAAFELHDYPLLISSSLELMERGWPGTNASARLRKVPSGYFLPQDRVRWMLLDPRGSLEDVVRNLLAKGDLEGAATAARGGPARSQPPEILPLLARVTFDAGDPATALKMLELLPADGQLFRGSVALALRVALRLSSGRTRPAVPEVVTKLIASGPVEDPDLPSAIDALLAAGMTSEVEPLLEWLAPQAPPFLGELLLRQAVARALAGNSATEDADLERAVALLDDGRPELGRLILASEGGDGEALAREAREVLETPVARDPVHRAALSLLAGERAAAVKLLEGQPRDGREFLGELVGSCLVALSPDEDGTDDAAPLSPALLEAVPVEKVLVLALALDFAPWNVWALARAQALTKTVRDDPWVRGLVAQGWFSLGAAGLARKALGPTPPEGETDARLAWYRVRAAREANAGPDAVLEAELAWLAASGRSSSEDPAVAPIEAAGAMRRGVREDAARILEKALEKRPADPDLRVALAELENTSGRRTRACELYSLVLTSEAPRANDPRVLAYLDVLRAAREEGEISEERWWSEVEAVEAERPEDPAPARELAQRAFERVGEDGTAGRANALDRLARFRTRTLERPLETLRSGESERWISLLARNAPARAVSIAEQELRRDPSDPGLWRASAVALLSAGHAKQALERLQALHELAPSPETARLLALTGLRVEDDPEKFAERLAVMKQGDPHVEDDPLLGFYGALFAARGEDEPAGLERALELWSARAENGLATVENGRALALRLFRAGRTEPALRVLDDARALVRGTLLENVLEAMAYLMKNAEVAPGPSKTAPDAPPPEAAADDAPSKKAGAGEKKSAGRAGKTKPEKGAAESAAGAEPKPSGAKPGARPKGAKAAASADAKTGAGGKDQTAPARPKPKKKREKKSK
jgi:hypothetical protein